MKVSPEAPEAPRNHPDVLDERRGSKDAQDHAKNLLSVGTSESMKQKAQPRKTGLFEFANTDAIKEKVRASREKKTMAYNVFNNYHETGVIQWIAKHSRFENTTLGVIVINAFWISVDTDGNTAETILDAKPMYVIMDSLFFVYFSIEVIIRFCAFKRKLDCFKDGWFKFDLTLVLLYGFDPFTLGAVAAANGGKAPSLPTAVLRLLRLARLSRLVRMLRSLPELMVMIKGMVTATSSVGYTLGLLMILTYVFAIALRNLVPAALPDEECAEKWAEGECIENIYFSSVPEAMHNLIIFGTFLDALSDFMWAVKEQSPACLILCWMYIALASLTVMNMLIGVLCEVISAVAAEESETAQVDSVHEKFDAILGKLDENHDGTISWDEFKGILEFPESLAALESMNVNPESMIDVAEDVFFDEGDPVAVSFDDFMAMVLDLRGGQQATVEHIMGSNKRFSKKFMKMKDLSEKIAEATNARQERLEAKVDTMAEAMKDMGSKMDQLLMHVKSDAPIAPLP